MADAPRRASRREWVATAAVVVAAGSLLVPSVLRAGNPYDEGMLVAYPDFVLRGLLPGRDFNFHYAPGSIWAVALVVRVFGPSVIGERVLGLFYRIMIIAAVAAVARRGGRRETLLAAFTTSLVLLPVGAQAIAWLGAMAFLLPSLEAAARAAARTGGSAWRWTALSGAFAGVTILFRLDVLPATLVSTLLFWRCADRARRWVIFAASMLVTSTPLLVHAARIGWTRLVASLLVEPRLSMPGRVLPLPPREPVALAFFVIATAGALAWTIAGARRVARDRTSAEARFDLALGVVCVLLLPQLLQRADHGHIVCVEIYAISLVGTLTMRSSPASSERRTALVRPLPAIAILVFAAVVAAPPLLDDLRVVFMRRGAPVWVERGGRGFPIGDPTHAADVQTMLAALDRVAHPGETIFVGPEDLRRTNLNDTFIYYLLPELRPASYFTAMVPGFTTQDDSPLPEQIASADFLLLTRRYDDWSEPNASAVPGSMRPNEIVRRRFCVIARHGSYSLYTPCYRSPP